MKYCNLLPLLNSHYSTENNEVLLVVAPTISRIRNGEAYITSRIEIERESDEYMSAIWRHVE